MRVAHEELRKDDFAFIYLDVDEPPIAWLAYRGLIISCDRTEANPGNISWHCVNTIRRGISSTLRREGILERIRQRYFPQKLSRLHCVYAHPTLEAARKASEGRGKFREENLVAIAPAGEFLREEYDSGWITNFDSMDAETAAGSYWLQTPSIDRAPELLLQGRFYVLGTSVRQRAYETITKESPRSLALLELARLAVQFGSDLGAIAPFVREESGEVVLSQIVKYDENEGLNVFRLALEKAASDKTFHINWQALKPLTTLESSADLDAAFSVPDFRRLRKRLRVEKADELVNYIIGA